MFSDFLLGFQSYSNALSNINKFGLKKYMLITGLISIALGVSIVIAILSLVPSFGGWVSSIYPWAWGKSFFAAMASFISGTALFFFGLLIYKYIILIIVSPFMSPLSENIESEITGLPRKSIGFMQTGKGFIRGFRISIRNFVKEIFISLGILLLSFVPGVGLAVPFLLFAVQAYFVGFGNLDYLLERHMSVAEASHFVRSHKGLAIANGSIFLFLLMIPIVGLFIAPSLATTAATMAGIKRLDKRIIH